MVLHQKYRCGNRFKRPGPPNWAQLDAWIAKNATPRLKYVEKQPEYGQKLLSIDWDKHNEWLRLRANPMKHPREPRKRPTRFCRPGPIDVQVLKRFLDKRSKPRAPVEPPPPFKGPLNSDRKLVGEKLLGWLKRNAKDRKVFKPPKLPKQHKKKLKLLLPRARILAQPKPFISPPKPRPVPAAVSPRAMKYKATLRMDVLAQPRFAYSDQECLYDQDKYCITQKGMKRIKELAKPSSRYRSLICSCQPKETFVSLPDHVLKYVATKRIVELSRPRDPPREITTDDTQYDSRKCLSSCYGGSFKTSRRTRALAVPRGGPGELVGPRKHGCPDDNPETNNSKQSTCAISYRKSGHGSNCLSSISQRLQLLALPRNPGIVFKDRPPEPKSPSSAALCYRATPRIQRLAVPTSVACPHFAQTKDSLPSAVSEPALHYVASPRIIEMALPREPVGSVP